MDEGDWDQLVTRARYMLLHGTTKERVGVLRNELTTAAQQGECRRRRAQ